MKMATKAIYWVIFVFLIRESFQNEEEKEDKETEDLEEDGKIIIKQGTAFVLEDRPYVSQQEVIFHQIIDFGPLYEALKETQELAQQLEQICQKYEKVFDLKEEIPQQKKGKVRKVRKRRNVNTTEEIRMEEKVEIPREFNAVKTEQKIKTHPKVEVLIKIIQKKLQTNITQEQLEGIIKEEVLKINESNSTNSFATQVGKALMQKSMNDVTGFWLLFNPDLHFQRQVINSMIKEIIGEEEERRKEPKQNQLCLAQMNGTELVSVRVARETAGEEERQRVQSTTYHIRDLRETERKYEVLSRRHVSKYEAEQLCKNNNMKLPEPNSEAEVQLLGTYLRIQFIDSAYIGTFFDPESSLHRYKENGGLLTDALRNVNLTAVKTVIWNLKGYEDDWNVIYAVNREGQVVVENEISEYKKNDGFLYEHLKKAGKVIAKELDRMKKPVVCEKKEESFSVLSSQPSVIAYSGEYSVRTISDNCQNAVHKIRMVSARITGKLLDTLSNYGIEVDSKLPPRTKRFVWTMVKASWDLYGNFMMHRKLKRMTGDIKKNRQDILENSADIEKNSKALQSLQVDMSVIKEDQDLMKKAIAQIDKEIILIKYTQVVDQIVMHILSINAQVELEFNTQLLSVQNVLEACFRGQVPTPLAKTIEKYMISKEKPLEALTIRSQYPIGVNPKMVDRQLHVYLAFIEGSEKYDLYKIIPLPYYKGERQKKRTVNYQYFLIDNKQTLFVPLSYEEAQTCKSGVCNLQAIYKRVTEDKCGVVAMSNKKVDEECFGEENPAEPFFHQTPHGLIFTVPHKLKGRLACREELDKAGQEGQVILKRLGVVHIPNGCDIVIEKPYLVISGPPKTITKRITGLEILDDVYPGDDIFKPLVNITSLTFDKIDQETSKLKLIIQILSVIGVLGIIGVIIPIAFKLYFVRRSIHRVKKRAKTLTQTVTTEVGTILNTIEELRKRVKVQKEKMHHLYQSEQLREMEEYELPDPPPRELEG